MHNAHRNVILKTRGAAACNGWTFCSNPNVTAPGTAHLSRWSIPLVTTTSNSASAGEWLKMKIKNLANSPTFAFYKVAHFAHNGGTLFIYPVENNNNYDPALLTKFNQDFPSGSTLDMVPDCSNPAYGPFRSACSPIDRNADRILDVRTGFYDASVNFDTMTVTAGAHSPVSSPAVLTSRHSKNRATLANPTHTIRFRVTGTDSGTSYDCLCSGPADSAAGSGGYPIRLVAQGRYLTHYYVARLLCHTKNGTSSGNCAALNLEASLELKAWTDSLELVLKAERAGFHGLVDVVGPGVQKTFQKSSAEGGVILFRNSSTEFSLENVHDTPVDQWNGTVKIVAKDALTNNSLSVGNFGASNFLSPKIVMPMKSNQQLLENRFLVELRNPSDKVKVFRLVFDRTGGQGITGVVPIIRDAWTLRPSGHHVQISKNWHKINTDRVPHDATWLWAITVFRLAPGSSLTFEMMLVYTRWGNAYSVSHAQLSLVGWGSNGLWEEVGLASNGESICMEPAGQQRLSIITDVRPFLVCTLLQKTNPDTCGGSLDGTGWTENVGGGGFFLAISHDQKYVHQEGTSSIHTAVGPSLTNATYSSTTSDGAAVITRHVSTARTVSHPRHLHVLKYKFLNPAKYRRLSLYQVGTSTYNYVQNPVLVWGDRNGKKGELQPSAWASAVKGNYLPNFRNVKLTGDGPFWFSLHSGTHGTDYIRSDRGLVIREYKVKVGGQSYMTPTFSVFVNTDLGNPASSSGRTISLELSAPPEAFNSSSEMFEFMAGDEVEATVELVIMPRKSTWYYGTDQAFKTRLTAATSTLWPLVQTEANANDIKVTTNTPGVVVERSYFPRIRAPWASQSLTFTITAGAASGVVGLVPITICNIWNPKGHTLKLGGVDVDKADQTARSLTYALAQIDRELFGRTKTLPFQQTTDWATYALTWNVNLTGSGPWTLNFTCEDCSKPPAKSLAPTAAPTAANVPSVSGKAMGGAGTLDSAPISEGEIAGISVSAAIVALAAAALAFCYWWKKRQSGQLHKTLSKSSVATPAKPQQEMARTVAPQSSRQQSPLPGAVDSEITSVVP
mmetsp:Transcript_12203/g.23335  ORF Transcript_12203/g.23335 Transcript_12203/m.23335 type:complete len:1070 (+) Transcript_12203:101-3310(+)